MEPVGIKEITELAEGLKLVAGAYKEVSADGKVDLSDIGVLVKLMPNVQKLVDAVQGLDKIPAEIKDLEEGEAALLLAQVYAILRTVKA